MISFTARLFCLFWFAVAAPPPLSDMEAAHPDQLAPEPAPPPDDCAFTSEVRCFPPSPTTAAWQMAPFSGCPRTVPRWSQESDLVSDVPSFSRAWTQRERLRQAGRTCGVTPDDGPCCYVQFSTRACD
jgi:hypothetical protein